MPTKSWKSWERRVSRGIGGRRTGILGGEDVEHEKWSVECKLLESVPKWLTSLWEQTTSNCPAGKTPLAVVKVKNSLDKDAFVVISWGTFRELIKNRDKKV